MPCGQGLLAGEFRRDEDADAVAGCDHAREWDVRSTLGEYGEKLTGPLVFHERPALKGNQQFRQIRLDVPRRGTQISICAEIKQAV